MADTHVTSLEIEICRTDRQSSSLSFKETENGASLLVSIPHNDRSLVEEATDGNYRAEIKRTRANRKSPFVLIVQKKKPKSAGAKALLRLNVRSTSTERCEVTVIGGTIDKQTRLELSSDFVAVTHDISSRNTISMKTTKGDLRINAKVKSPSLQLCACDGNKNIVLMTESKLICQDVSFVGQKASVDGQIFSSGAFLNIQVEGNLHVGTHGLIGQPDVNSTRLNASVGLRVSGNLQNYGRIISSESVRLHCNNYLTCLTNSDETVQKGYFALKSSSNITFEGEQLNETGTIKDLHAAIRALDKKLVVKLLELGADPAVALSETKGKTNALELAQSLVVTKYGGSYDEDDLSTKNDIINLLNWWLHRRGEIVSGVIDIHCDHDLEDCSQLKSSFVNLRVDGSAIVERDSFWTCGEISGYCRGDFVVDGTWKLKRLNNLNVYKNLVTSLSGKVIVAEGGTVKIHENFINEETWYNMSKLLSLECGTIRQEDWATIRCQEDLEIIINNDTTEQWYGDVIADGVINITSRGKVQCQAEVHTPKHMFMILETREQPSSFEIAGQCYLGGPLIVKPKRNESSEQCLLLVNGTLHACGLLATKVDTRFLPQSTTTLKPTNGKGIYLQAGNIVTDVQSQIDMAIENENQKVILKCEDTMTHNGEIKCHGQSDDASVSGEMHIAKFINHGRIEGFNCIHIDMLKLFENHADLMVPGELLISGEGTLTNEAVLASSNGPLSIDGLTQVYLRPDSLISGDTISVQSIGHLLNEGGAKSKMGLSLALCSLDNTNGTLNSLQGDISIAWLTNKEEECILQGIVQTRSQLTLTTNSEKSLTVHCTDRSTAEGPQAPPDFKIPPNGLDIISPLAHIIIQSVLIETHGNELVNIATGVGCEIRSKSCIPNLSLSMSKQANQTPVLIDASGSLDMQRMVAVSNNDISELVLKGNILLKNEGAIICNCDNSRLVFDCSLNVAGSCIIMSPHVNFTECSKTLLDIDKIETPVCIEASDAISLMGKIDYAQIESTTTKLPVVKLQTNNMTISKARLKIPCLAASMKGKLVIEEDGHVDVKQFIADVGGFELKVGCVLGIHGDEESVIFVKTEQTHLSGRLITEGTGTLVVQSTKDIVTDAFCCELGNISSHFESTGRITLSKNCQVSTEGELVLKSTMDEGSISIEGEIKGKCSVEKQPSKLVMEGFCITLTESKISQMASISLSAENILDMKPTSLMKDSRCIAIEAKVLQMHGEVSNAESIEIKQWSSIITGKLEATEQIKIISELLLVNSGIVTAKNIGIVTPVLISAPFDANKGTSAHIPIPQIGNPATETLVIEGMLSIWVKSLKTVGSQGSIDVKSLLHFEFSSATSTMPDSKSLDNWKKAMSDVIQPAAAADANMQSLLNAAMKIQKVACHLGSASSLCQGIMNISNDIQEKGVEHFQMNDIVGVLGKAHEQYSNIYSFRKLLETDKLLRKIKDKKTSAKKTLRKYFRENSFSQTLVFNKSRLGSVYESSFISKRTGSSDVYANETYAAESKLWENDSSLESSCGDIMISAPVISHRGSKTRALKACHRIMMDGEIIDVQGAKAKSIKVEGKQEVTMDSAECDQLSATGGDVYLSNAKVNDQADIQADYKVSIESGVIRDLNAKGKDVILVSTKVTKAVVKGSDQGTVSNTTADNPSCTAEIDVIFEKQDVKVDNAEFDQLSDTGKYVALSTVKVNEYDDIQAINNVSIESSDIGDLEAKGKDVKVESSKLKKAVIEGANQVTVSNTTAGKLLCTAKNDVNLENITAETVSAVSKTKDIKAKGKVKAKKGALHAEKGNVVFDNSGRSNVYGFNNLSMKQSTMSSKRFEELLNRSGAYDSLKVSDQLDLAIDDDMVINAQIESFNHGISLEAKSIDVRATIYSDKSVKLEAKGGGINVGSNKRIQGESVSLKAKQDIVHAEGSVVIAKQDVREESTQGSITLNAAHVSGGRFVGLSADKDINVLAVGGEHSAARKSYVSGGTGLEYEDNGEVRHLGMQMTAGRNTTVDASSVSSSSDNMITVENDIVFKTRCHKYKSKSDAITSRFTTTKTEEWSTKVDRANVSSSGGRNVIQAIRGGITSTATDFKALENHMIAEGTISLQDLIVRTETLSSKMDKIGGLFYRKVRRESHEESQATVVRNQSALANTFIMSKRKDINLLGCAINTALTAGNLTLDAPQGTVNLQESILDHRIEETLSGFFGKKVDNGVSFGYRYESCVSDYQSTAGNKTYAEGSACVEAKSFHSNIDVDIEGDMKIIADDVQFSTPELKNKTTAHRANLAFGNKMVIPLAKFTYDYSKVEGNTRGQSCINITGNLCSKGDSLRVDQGYGITVGKDFTIDHNYFGFTGAEESHTSSSVGLSIGTELTDIGAGLQIEFSDGIVNRNQKTRVGGKCIAKYVHKADLDGAGIECDDIEGEIGSLTVQSRQDTHNSKEGGFNLGFDVTKEPTFGVNYGVSREKSVGELATLHVNSGGSEQLRVDKLNLTGALVKFKGKVDKFTSCIVAKDLHDISDAINTNVQASRPKTKRLGVSVGIGGSKKKAINRATVLSSTGNIDDNISTTVNTNSNKMREEKYDRGGHLQVTVVKKLKKDQKMPKTGSGTVKQIMKKRQGKSLSVLSECNMRSGNRSLSFGGKKCRKAGGKCNLSIQSEDKCIGGTFTNSQKKKQKSLTANFKSGKKGVSIGGCTSKGGKTTAMLAGHYGDRRIAGSYSSNEKTGESSMSGNLKSGNKEVSFDRSTNKEGETKGAASARCGENSVVGSYSSNTKTGQSSMSGNLRTFDKELSFDRSTNKEGETKGAASARCGENSVGGSYLSNTKTGESSMSGNLKTGDKEVSFDRSTNKEGETKGAASARCGENNVGGSYSSNTETGQSSMSGNLKTGDKEMSFDQSTNKEGETKGAASARCGENSVGGSYSSNTETGQSSMSGNLKTGDKEMSFDQSTNKEGEAKGAASARCGENSVGGSYSSNTETGQSSMSGNLKTGDKEMSFDQSTNKEGETKGAASARCGENSVEGSYSSNTETGQSSMSGNLKTGDKEMSFDRSTNKEGETKGAASARCGENSLGGGYTSNTTTGQSSMSGNLKTGDKEISFDRSTNIEGETRSAVSARYGDNRVGGGNSSNDKTGESCMSCNVNTGEYKELSFDRNLRAKVEVNGNMRMISSERRVGCGDVSIGSKQGTISKLKKPRSFRKMNPSDKGGEGILSHEQRIERRFESSYKQVERTAAAALHFGYKGDSYRACASTMRSIVSDLYTELHERKDKPEYLLNVDVVDEALKANFTNSRDNEGDKSDGERFVRDNGHRFLSKFEDSVNDTEYMVNSQGTDSLPDGNLKPAESLLSTPNNGEQLHGVKSRFGFEKISEVICKNDSKYPSSRYKGEEVTDAARRRFGYTGGSDSRGKAN